MATTTHETENKKSHDEELKHFGFVKFLVIEAFVCVSNLYQFAKHNSGSLRFTVGTVEGIVTNVLGPIYEKIRDIPLHLLVFVDNKVDEATHKFIEYTPPLLKQVANQAKVLVNEVHYLIVSGMV